MANNDEATKKSQAAFDAKALSDINWYEGGKHIAVSEPLTPEKIAKVRDRISDDTKSQIRMTVLPPDRNGNQALVANAMQLELLIKGRGIEFEIQQAASVDVPPR